MKKLLLPVLAILFICIAATTTVQALNHFLPSQPETVIEQPILQKGPVYYVKIGDTISLLKDPQGYIIAANRLGMKSIKVVPDKSGKYYRTVSLDLDQSDEDMKAAIEVETINIIVK